MGAMYHPCEPVSTQDLIRQARSTSDPRELVALGALETAMIEAFEENPSLVYMAEVADISSLVTGELYQTVIATFANKIIHGTTDGDVLNSKVLVNFTRALRRAPDVLSAESAHLGSVLDSLRERLDKAGRRAELTTQYQLCHTLAGVLDAMLDIKVYGLNRESLHQPLLDKLKGLQDHQEPRLAQVAGYAYQGLLGISNDEGTYEAVWRNTGSLVVAVAKIAGAVPTLDPSKLVDATPDVMHVLSVISSMVLAARNVYTASQEMKDVVGALRAISKQKGWYMALRYADLLIIAQAYQMLEEFICHQPCHDMNRFWSGLYFRLERAWVQGPSHTRERIVEIIEGTFPYIRSKYQLAQKCIMAISETLDRPNWKVAFNDVRHRVRFWKRDEYEPKLQMLATTESTSPDQPSKLLQKALTRCETAASFFVDIELSNYYTRGGYLEIKRLSGDLLDMEQCYINLTLVEHSSQLNAMSSDQSEERQESAFTLFSRLQVGTTRADTDVDLPSLFDNRKLLGGQKNRPRRTLIRGRAGVGKTTLCKKIVHDFLHGRLWAELFNRIVWIPLRSLKNKSSLRELLHDYFQYSSSKLGHDGLVSALWSNIFGPDGSKTLLLLDGLDEISDERNAHETDMIESLKDVLNYPNVIVTSRPAAVGLPGLAPFDLELETVGFQENQVTAYVTKVIENPTTQDEIKVFVKKNWLIQGLIQIPIQLDALCYCWDDEFRSSEMRKTMTALYQAIEKQLWKKDVLRLEKRNERGLLSENKVRRIRQRHQLQTWVGKEMEMLEFLAFTGLQNDIIEFTAAHRDEIYQKSGIPGMSDDVDDVLDSSSFLRTSDLSKGNSTTYHFLHLTFQEFFAAHHFVRCWITGKDIYCFTLGANPPKPNLVSPEIFVEREKYNGRYDIFWRFVAGLLHFRDQEQLCRLLEKIEDRPHDMLGPTHLRLLMHCFGEIPDSNKNLRLQKLRREMEMRCRQWSNWESTTFALFSLCSEAEFPENVLIQLFEDESDTGKALLVSAIRNRNQPSSFAIQELLFDFVRNKADVYVYQKAADAFRPGHSLSPKVLTGLSSKLMDPDPAGKLFAFWFMQPSWPFPEDFEARIISLLRDDNVDVWHSAYAFVRLSPQRILGFVDTLTSFLVDENGHTRCCAVLLLAHVSRLPQNALKCLFPGVEHAPSGLRDFFLEELKKWGSESSCPSFPDEALDFLALQLKYGSHGLRRYVSDVLATQLQCSDKAAVALLSFLSDPDFTVRGNASRAQRESSAGEKYFLYTTVREIATSSPILLDSREIEPAMDDWVSQSQPELEAYLPPQFPTPHSRSSSYSASLSLASSSSSSSGMDIDTLIHQLEDQSDPDLADSAAKALVELDHLPDRALKALISCWTRDGPGEEYAARVLEKHPDLSEDVMTALSSYIGDDLIESEPDNVTIWPSSFVPIFLSVALKALLGQPCLPESLLRSSLSQLKYANGGTFGGLEQLFWKRDYFSYLLLDLDTLRRVYRDWIYNSMRNHMVCYVENDVVHVVSIHETRTLSSPHVSTSEIRALLFRESAALENPAASWYTF